jgi:peptidoglycan/LPS O-acetylase OafA/YrhL
VFFFYFYSSFARISHGLPAKEDRMLRNLDRRDTLVLKGVAISAIVFHNYFHAIGPVRENEFVFSAAVFQMFQKTLNNPILAIEGIFSFFGHFGVGIFVFLSAYGLAKSHWNNLAPWSHFLLGRIEKLYPVFGLVIVPWFVLVAVNLGPLQALSTVGVNLLWMLTGVSNLLPGYGLPPVGPWWFIPFIVQFYALWPLLKRFTVRFGQFGLLALAALSAIFVYVANPGLGVWSMTLLDTPVGRMPEICLGIMAARFPMRLNVGLVLAAAADLFLGSVHRVFWPLTFVSALILSLSIYLWMRNILRSSRLLERIGQYSLLIFLLNGIVRMPFLAYATSPVSALFFGCVSAVISFIVAVLIQEFLMPASMSNKFKPVPSAENPKESAVLVH